MVTLSTLGGIPDEQGLADVASAADTLTDGLPDEILTTSSGRDRENELLALGSHGLRLGFGLLGLLFGLRGRIAEALLAAQVVTLGAKLVDTEAGQATMAVAANTHTDGLVDTLSVLADGTYNPLIGLKRQAILLKQSTGSLLLSVTPFLGVGRGGGLLDSLLRSCFGTA